MKKPYRLFPALALSLSLLPFAAAAADGKAEQAMTLARQAMDAVSALTERVKVLEEKGEN